MKDKLFQDPLPEHQAFAFNDKVAAVFDDMISRSVPGYSSIQEFSAEFSLRNFRPGATIYDLGCSTGTSLIKIAQKILESRAPKELTLIGIDSSYDMIKRSQEKIAAFELEKIITVKQEDIRSVTLQSAALVICHYTLQFLAPTDRLLVIKKIYAALEAEGHFIVSEKVIHSSAILQQILTDNYDKFKLQNGYSELEITRKRQALENVLIPITIEDNINLLKEAGFKSVEIIQKELCFVSFLARK